MGRKKAEVEDGSTPKPKRIGLELSDDVTLEVAAYCAERPFVKEGVVKDIIREEARQAAEDSVLGHVAEILTAKLK